MRRAAIALMGDAAVWLLAMAFAPSLRARVRCEELAARNEGRIR
ncbi:MAG TPA: hypothetical protein VL326_17640 [Kofleriaceae bacterium]|jgi:hypothetical protein|nr:hypothetical protein [Kofleriaceae bacterium]